MEQANAEHAKNHEKSAIVRDWIFNDIYIWRLSKTTKVTIEEIEATLEENETSIYVQLRTGDLKITSTLKHWKKWHKQKILPHGEIVFSSAI